jgi:hypothetical protein
MTTVTYNQTALAAHWYGLGLAGVWGSQIEGGTAYNIDWITDTMMVALYKSGGPPNRNTGQFYVATNEVGGAQYTAGGKEITSRTLAYASNIIKFDGADTVWPTGAVAGASAELAWYAVIYDSTAGADASHRPVMGYLDWTTGTGLYSAGTSGVFTIIWPAAGIFTITIS